jgi:hypothetical protein
MRLEAFTIHAIPGLIIFLMGAALIFKITILGHIPKEKDEHKL